MSGHVIKERFSYYLGTQALVVQSALRDSVLLFSVTSATGLLAHYLSRPLAETNLILTQLLKIFFPLTFNQAERSITFNARILNANNIKRIS